ncbi:hypothetical protein M9H77_31210 [Catharanthus roseus]|uniref:Uncharacterized protein n=1 Tax=Catharanthus roseus TaxID=4058 RepID=A0ACC0A3P6_CATRO|nr:hypothetical protein M9H77_31210 [Catharanthus roseus]
MYKRISILPADDFCGWNTLKGTIQGRAVNCNQPLWQPPFAVHRFCLRYIRANFNKTFKNTNLKSLMWQAGTEIKQWKFDRVMKEIQERNIDAYIYLMKLDLEKWILLHDGGHRHGIMTTNIS